MGLASKASEASLATAAPHGSHHCLNHPCTYHPPSLSPQQSVEKLYSIKLISGAKQVGDYCLRVMGSKQMSVKVLFLMDQP